MGNVPIVLPLGRGRGRHDARELRHLLPHARHVLATGEREFGLDGCSPESLDPFFRRVERELNVAQVPPELAGRNAEVVKRGVDALGWSGDYIHRNATAASARACARSAARPRPSSTSGITYVPRAWDGRGRDLDRLRAPSGSRSARAAHGGRGADAGGGALSVEGTT